MFSIKDALEKMIHEDLPQLLKLTTEEAASAEAASMAQLGTGASPFAVMKVGGSVGLGRWIGQPFRLFQSFPDWWTCCQCCPSNMTSLYLGLVGSNYGFVGFYFSAVVGARSPHFYRIVYHAPVKRTLLTWDSSSRLGIKIACLYTFLEDSWVDRATQRRICTDAFCAFFVSIPWSWKGFDMHNGHAAWTLKVDGKSERTVPWAILSVVWKDGGLKPISWVLVDS